jgi:transglutaminase-like putative cysteine protease
VRDVSTGSRPDNVRAVNESQVACTLGFDVTEPAEIVLQIAAVDQVSEALSVSSDGRFVDAVELPGRQHLVRAPAGTLTVTYTASIDADRPAPPGVTEFDRVVALRPSRYCPSDRLAGFAGRQFTDRAGRPGTPTETVRAITDWVFEHLSYEAGTSGPSTDAVDTLLGAAGVCRDYAHLVATLCRAMDVPARVAAVYAPGLSPMDFHLVVETALDGQWRVWDATRLAPRQSLIRIATGRDAADTALATTLSGRLTMPDLHITAIAPGNLPLDDHTGLVSLP